MPIYRCEKEVKVNGLTQDFTISPGELYTVTVVDGTTDKYSLVYKVADRTVEALISDTQLQKLISDGSLMTLDSD
jgi:hypothetical protein